MGNRIFGCDDCQLVCPWNKFARPGKEADFAPRHGLDQTGLVELFGWSEAEWPTAPKAAPSGGLVMRAGYAISL